MLKKIKTFGIDILFDIVGGFMYAMGIAVFAKSAYFATGGISGITLMLNHLFDWNIGLMTVLMNIPLMIISVRFVGKGFLFRTLKSMLFYTIFLDYLFPLLPVYSGQRMLASIFAGVCMGLGMALLYMRGSSSGGSDFVTLSIRAVKPHMSVGRLTLIFDAIVILCGWAAFGNVEAVMYGLISTTVGTTVIDKILYDAGAGGMLLIITSKGEAVSETIIKEFNRGTTLLNGTGSFTKAEKQVLMCACSRPEAYKIKSAAQSIDREAFIILTATSEVFGKGFEPVHSTPEYSKTEKKKKYKAKKQPKTK